jgi:hypothetical protein
MSDVTIMWILGGMNAVTWLLIGWVKMDIKALWKRADSHGHTVVCDHVECRAKTDAVVLHEGH